MPIFSRIPYPSSTRLTKVGERYRRHLNNHPFLLFGLPFIATMVAGSFFLTPATAIRYERYDRKTHMLDRNEAMGFEKFKEQGKMKFKQQGGKGDIREEYYRLAGKVEKMADAEWEPIRVKRLPGEPDGTFD